MLDLAQKPEVDIAHIARVISKDPALSGKILRTVNSSFYGRSNNVGTISHALVILGLQSVKTLVLGFSLVANVARDKDRGFDHVAYWKRSIYSATAARALAARINLVQQEEAFLASLLSDIGMLALDPPDNAGQLAEETNFVTWKWNTAGPPGVYQVKRGPQTVFAVASTVPREESDLRAIDPSTLQRLTAGRDVHYDPTGAGGEDQKDRAWAWALAACAACMIVELGVLRGFRT